MLNGIHLVDYGDHRDTRLTFGRMTALVGQNGAGKTNALRGIMEVEKRAFRQQGEPDDFGEEKVRSGASEWLISAGWPGTLWTSEQKSQLGSWAVCVSARKSPTWLWRADVDSWVPRPSNDWNEITAWDHRDRLLREYGSLSGQVASGEIVRPLERKLSSVWISPYFKTAGNYLQEPSYSERPIPILSEDCRDLAWMIAYLKGDQDEVFGEITAALRKVVPTFRRVRHRPSLIQRLERKEVIINKQSRSYEEEQTVMGQELRFDMASGHDLPASSISEGTLITLAVLTAVMYDDESINYVGGSKTILLDDIESGLHPSAQRDLVRQLRRLQETRPELQIIFSSHSPYIIDEMQPEDVWLFAPDKEGIAHCAKLSDHPDAKRALEVLTTGEFWSAEGEGWVLDRAQRSDEETVAAAK